MSPERPPDYGSFGIRSATLRGPPVGRWRCETFRTSLLIFRGWFVFSHLSPGFDFLILRAMADVARRHAHGFRLRSGAAPRSAEGPPQHVAPTALSLRFPGTEPHSIHFRPVVLSRLRDQRHAFRSKLAGAGVPGSATFGPMSLVTLAMLDQTAVEEPNRVQQSKVVDQWAL